MIHLDPSAQASFADISSRTLLAHDEIQSRKDSFKKIECKLSEALSPLFLREQPFAEKGYFQFKERAPAMWFGCAFEYTSLQPSAIANLPEDANLYGGMRFDLDSLSSAEWEQFGRGRFFLPRFEILNDKLSIWIHSDEPRAQIERDLSLVNWQVSTAQTKEKYALKRLIRPDLRLWEQGICKVQNGSFEKVVLAQKFQAEYSSALCPWSSIIKLKKDTESGASEDRPYLFALQIGQKAFIGKSPERLYLREGKALVSEAVAGTDFDSSSTSIGAFESLMKANNKVHEHALVVRALEKGVAHLCKEFQSGKLRVKKASHLNHLHEEFSGTLKEGMSDFDILRELHPTPAVGGFPKEKAIEAIRNIENFDRGWYAGPIGIFSKEKAEFAVAIRSGLIEQEVLTLYGGCGIVDTSNPESEFAESESKVMTLLNAL